MGKQISVVLATWSVAAAAAKSHQSCLTLCDPIDGSPPGSSVPGILQTRTLEGVAISFSNAWKWKVKVKSLSRVRFLATPWTVAYQAPPPMGFPRQEYWSGVPLPSLLNPLGNYNVYCETMFCFSHLEWKNFSLFSQSAYLLFHLSWRTSSEQEYSPT